MQIQICIPKNQLISELEKSLKKEKDFVAGSTMASNKEDINFLIDSALDFLDNVEIPYLQGKELRFKKNEWSSGKNTVNIEISDYSYDKLIYRFD